MPAQTPNDVRQEIRKHFVADHRSLPLTRHWGDEVPDCIPCQLLFSKLHQLEEAESHEPAQDT